MGDETTKGDMSVITSFGRWWDYYFLRYFVGTIVGAIIVRSLPLYCAIYDSLRPSGGTMMNLTSSAALGFAYCYIASAPMFTLHVTRAHLFRRKGRDGGSGHSLELDWQLKLLEWCGILTVIALCATCLWYNCLPHWRLAASLLLFVVLVVQISMLARARLDKFKVVTDFYWKLSQSRSAPEPNISEYKESYRHIREHGNAYAIVVLELALGVIAASLQKPWEAGMVLALWLLPAAYCWLVATILESS
jgi:hypothetical protein